MKKTSKLLSYLFIEEEKNESKNLKNLVQLIENSLKKKIWYNNYNFRFNWCRNECKFKEIFKCIWN